MNKHKTTENWSISIFAIWEVDLWIRPLSTNLFAWKKQNPFLICSYLAAAWFVVRKPELTYFVDVIFTLSLRTRRCYCRYPWVPCSSSRLLRPLLLNLNLFHLKLQQKYMLQRITTSLHFRTILGKEQAFACYDFCVSHSRFGAKIRLDQQWNGHCSLLIAIAPFLLSFEIG